MKTSDLNLNYKLNEHQPLTISNNNQTNLSNQKRSFSHTQFNKHETNQTKTQDHGYDLKKQVLAPE